MIIEKPNIEERLAASKGSINPQQKEAMKTINELLEQINFTAEIVPADNPERLIKLLASLKGDQLNNSEVNLVYEIVSR